MKIVIDGKLKRKKDIFENKIPAKMIFGLQKRNVRITSFL